MVPHLRSNTYGRYLANTYGKNDGYLERLMSFPRKMSLEELCVYFYLFLFLFCVIFVTFFLLLCKYSCFHFPTITPPYPSHPHFPPLILPLFGFVHVSFIYVPENPSPLLPLSPPTCPLVTFKIERSGRDRII